MNTQNEQTEEEIPNIEQFQVSRSSLEEKDLEEDNTNLAGDDAGYTEDEVEFADGEGTQLDEEIPDETEDDDDDLLADDDLTDDDLTDDDLADDDLEEDEEI